MATQVEALLPGNPLAKKAEEEEEEEDEGGAERRAAGVAEPGSGGGGGSPGLGGTPEPEERTSNRGEEEEDDNGGKSRKEFTEAPPPKVNPWTKKMNAVTVVSVNGQAHHGAYRLSVLCRVCPSGRPARCGRTRRPSSCHVFNAKRVKWRFI